MIFQINDSEGDSLGLLSVENTAVTRRHEFEYQLTSLARDLLDTCNDLGGDTDWFWENLPDAVERDFACKCERVFLTKINL